MKRLFSFPLIFFLLTSLCWMWGCAGPPRLHFFSEATLPMIGCRDLQLSGSWQFVHIVEATPPGYKTVTLMGVVQIHETLQELHCALLSLEGLVLFEAHWKDGETTVLRALPPFDKPGFTDGLMADLGFIFLAPEITSQVFGRMDDGTPVCRYELADGEIRDMMAFLDGGWKLMRYAKGSRLVQTLMADGPSDSDPAAPMPRHLSLITHGLLGYRLTLTLVSADALSSSASSSEK
ncbi:hypothetical protein LJC71_02385 [Desulfosarcina sp. OttesenSCG-928-A07]|nr:hypothetical protein [Desulfosarcina sp. OttesenSCG-928-G17]MDL2328585.1 hypothetical protein [Desulfosarcina sp. OttesenSCG-928-A07]